MPTTITALVLLLVAVIPGAVATLAFEHAAGQVRGDTNDRLVRFVAATGALTPLPAVAGWLVWAHLVHIRSLDPAGKLTFRNQLRDGPTPSLWWLALPVVYVAVAAAAGLAAGHLWELRLRRRSRRREDGSLARGTRSWDLMFGGNTPRVVSARLRDGRAVGGLFASGSIASNSTDPTRELILERSYRVDEDATVVRGDDGVPLEQGQGGMIRVREADVLYFRIEEHGLPAGADAEADEATPEPPAPVDAGDGLTGGTGHESERPAVTVNPNESPVLEQAFSGTKAAQIVGITYRQLDYWARTDLVRPTLGDRAGSGTRRAYSYRDLLELRMIKNLLDAGITLESVRDVFSYLRTHVETDIASAHLVISGNQVVLTDGNSWIDLVRQGQGVLNVLPLASVKEEVDAAIIELGPEPPLLDENERYLIGLLAAAFEAHGWQAAQRVREGHRIVDLVATKAAVNVAVEVVGSRRPDTHDVGRAVEQLMVVAGRPEGRKLALGVPDTADWRAVLDAMGVSATASGVRPLFIRDDGVVDGMDGLGGSQPTTAPGQPTP